MNQRNRYYGPRPGPRFGPSLAPLNGPRPRPGPEPRPPHGLRNWQRHQRIAAKAWQQWNNGVFLRKESTCFRCGRVSYRDHKHFCRAIFAGCYSCKKLSHYSRVCRSNCQSEINPVSIPIENHQQAEFITPVQFPDQPFFECDNTELQYCLHPSGPKDYELNQIKAKLHVGQTKAHIIEGQSGTIQNLEDEITRLKMIEQEQRETISNLQTRFEASESEKQKFREGVEKVALENVTKLVRLNMIEQEQRETILNQNMKLEASESEKQKFREGVEKIALENVTKLARHVSEVQSEFVKVRTECEDIKRDYTTLQSDHQILQNHNREKDEEISGLQEEIEDLRSELDVQCAPFPNQPQPPIFSPPFQNSPQPPMYAPPYQNAPGPPMYSPVNCQNQYAPQFMPNGPQRGKNKRQGKYHY